MRTFRTELKMMYRDYYNNYLTIETFAEHHAVAYDCLLYTSPSPRDRH